MINKLTQEQISKFPYYVDKWTKIGLSTERISFEETKNIVNGLYKEILGYKSNPIVILMDSPISAWYATLICFYEFNKKNQVGIQVWSQVENQVCIQVESQVGNQVWSQVWSQVRSQVDNQVKNQVWDQVENQVCNQVGSQVGNQVRNQVRSQVDNQLGSQVGNFIYPYIDGHFISGYFSFYDYIQKELKIDLDPKFEIYKETTKLELFYCFKDFCVVSQKPTEIHIKNGILNNENGPSIKYADNFEVYSLNGIRVPKEIVLTPWNELDANLILKEQNAEIRREIVRKIGIEKVCKDLKAKIIDKKYGYELLNLKLSKNDYRPYLKMLNPSIGIYHIEGVPIKCKTVEDALISRKPKEMKMIPISESGDDWYQQGDVCIWNKKSKSLKMFPKILT